MILVSALFALSASNTSIHFVYLAYFPSIAFWILDAFYLWQERLFRALYDHVRKMDEDEIDFSMNTSIVKHQVKPWSEIIFSTTLLIFHATILISIMAVTLIALSITRGD